MWQPVADGFGDLINKLEKVADKLERADMRQRLTTIGDVAVTAADEVLSADTGGGMSLANWRRGRPIKLGNSRKLNVGAGTVEVGPKPRARGPVTVLSQGRKAGVAKSGRPVSASRGHGTWPKAVDLMAVRVPDAADKDVQAILRSQFGG